MSSIVEEHEVYPAEFNGVEFQIEAFARGADIVTASTSDLPVLVEREILRQRLGHSVSVPIVAVSSSGSLTPNFETPQGSFIETAEPMS